MAETNPKRIRNTGWWEEHCRGVTLRTIAQREGVSVGTVHAGIQQVRDSIPEVQREEIRKDIHQLYQEIMAEALEIARMLPPPVVAGKDGKVIDDPEHPDVVHRDYSGRLTALRTAADMADRARKMFGVDEASRVVVESGEDEETRRQAAESAAYLHQGEGPNEQG